MQLFIDTANVKEIKRVNEMGVICGVTTNPSLIAKEGRDFKEVVKSLHDKGIRVVIDGVFNHVGRNFFAFSDVREKKWDSQYKDWFNISFDGNSQYDDGFWYEGWEGYYNLVKLNLRNNAVVEYLLDCVRFWVSEFDIDGIRLDVAYCLDHDFMRRLRQLANGVKDDFFLFGEMIHGDYKTVANNEMLHFGPCKKHHSCSYNCNNNYTTEMWLKREENTNNQRRNCALNKIFEKA